MHTCTYAYAHVSLRICTRVNISQRTYISYKPQVRLKDHLSLLRAHEPSFQLSKQPIHFKETQKKGKAVPLQAWSGPEGSGKLRFPDFMTTAQNSGKVVRLMHRPPLPPGNVPGTHFCWRLSRAPGHSAIGRILCE